jgi:hypothetical protein
MASYSARAADNWITVARSLRSAALHVALRRPGPYGNSAPTVVPRWKCHGVRPGCRGGRLTPDHIASAASSTAAEVLLSADSTEEVTFRAAYRSKEQASAAGGRIAETWEESVMSAVSVPRICGVCGKVNHRSSTAARWFASRDSLALRVRVYCCPASGNSWHLTSRHPPRRLRGGRRGRQNGFSRPSRGGRARRRGDYRVGWS